MLKNVPNPEKKNDPKVDNTQFNDQRAPSILVHLDKGAAVAFVRNLILLLFDATFISLGWLTAKWVVISNKNFQSVESFDLIGSSPEKPGYLLLILAMTISIIASAGLYSRRDTRRRFLRLVSCLTLAQIIFIVLAFLYKPGIFLSRSLFLLAWFFSVVFVLFGRFVLELAVIKVRSKGILTRKIFLIGTPRDTLAAKIALKLISNREFKITGQIDLSTIEAQKKWPSILQEIQHQQVGEVFVCSWQSIPNSMSFYWSLKTAGINLRVLPVGLELPYQSPQIEMIGRMPTIQFTTPAIVGTDFWVKRGFDLTVAVLIVIFASPILLLIAVLIKLDSPGPIFYKQTRLGLRGRHFKVWKFRTMVINADQLMKELEAKNEIKGGVLFKMKDDPRITKVGKVLRQYSLDELPQLINVLIGQMSLVGPRPLPLRDVEGFAPHHFARQNVLPGITGLWQVSGRSDIIDFENAFRLDVMYINNWSLLLDFQILWKTVQVVLKRKGAY
ncbi:sugar transferase [Limnoraphis robusta Tam1]|uniref:Sugar transferase n=1 Tax=Limnoraphis robusta CCNP1315 TaxID=3110306 RepID=A0ABU5U2Y4_9CYAN|nr:sugar transferase [Limnoraphis robusta]MEA5499883.1 sugar transferase [Limnoraphis robusta BA-68 BA1]MEA5521559.1 sugar transferase [Limnoraphis robusta CCNP1315]MEA5543054.1 sugar transferase [Limnoraphis robusta Tam1]MEA5545799.1 sugar transferase [Limnoraphis robusta CCNP1324]